MEILDWLIAGTSFFGLAVYCAGMTLLLGALAWANHLDHRQKNQGRAKPITLTVIVESEPLDKRGSVAFVAKGTIMRSDFGMKFGVPPIDDALEITVKTRAVSDD